MSGKNNKEERQEYINILNTLLDKGADGIILACTELPLVINYEALGDKIVNSTNVLAEGLVDYYYADKSESEI